MYLYYYNNIIYWHYAIYNISIIFTILSFYLSALTPVTASMAVILAVTAAAATAAAVGIGVGKLGTCCVLGGVTACNHKHTQETIL